ncbi:hypothetical protein OVA03_11000 [Asticcacaulis sp. SL142]|uniref:hypothetical protein n=1 Tax=Asticcacaulis sp. SL142 TaxID=2995155 RepID=UPI00226C8848|nr:hypothetical protein [Asticcacaulis sp. SL142]WAC47232.1 hypothetical protein OVA03_11000 [Asticcacaulis sp. SL142]
MKLTALRLHNVRRFAGSGIAIENIGDGVNILCEANEFGKSTCFDALHALFFQPASGRPAAIQALQPYSGSPVIEADITTPKGQFRLRKQYLGGKKAQVTDLSAGRLIAQADEAEAFISELISGGAAGPSGLLWVRQGVTGLETPSKTELNAETKARETILTSVQGEVEAITGGRRMRAIMEACEFELSKLVTATHRPKAGGPYEIALSARDALQARVTTLQAEVDTLHAALERRRTVRLRLSELDNPDEDAARRQAVETATHARDAARLYDERFKALTAQADLTQSQAKLTAETRDSYQNALSRYDAITGDLKTATERHTQAQHERETAQTASDHALTAQGQAEAEEKDMRTLLDRLERALRAKAAAEQISRLKDALTEAETLRQTIERAEADLRALALPAKEVEALEQLEMDIARLDAAGKAQATRVRMDYAPQTAARISLNDTHLPDGAEVAVTSPSSVSLPGLGVLTLCPAPVDESVLQALMGDRAALLKRLGVDHLAQARLRQHQAQALSGQIALDRQRLKHLAPDGLDAVRDSLARLEAENAPQTQEDLELKGDPVQVRAALEAAGARVAAARHQVTETRPLRDMAVQSVMDRQADLTHLSNSRDGLEALLGAASERPAHLQGLIDAAQSAHEAAVTVQAQLETLSAKPMNLENAEAALRRAQSVLEGVEREKNDLRQALAQLTGSISAQSGRAVEEDLAEALDQLRNRDEAVKRFEHEVAQLRHLKETLGAAHTQAREHYFAPVLGELRPLLGLSAAGRHDTQWPGRRGRGFKRRHEGATGHIDPAGLCAVDGPQRSPRTGYTGRCSGLFR